MSCLDGVKVSTSLNNKESAWCLSETLHGTFHASILPDYLIITNTSYYGKILEQSAMRHSGAASLGLTDSSRVYHLISSPRSGQPVRLVPNAFQQGSLDGPSGNVYSMV